MSTEPQTPFYLIDRAKLQANMDKMARLRELPFGRYYGGVDTTPLFVALAGAYADDGIRVNSVAPGPVLTQMFERFTGGSSDAKAGITGAVPLGRGAQADDACDAAHGGASFRQSPDLRAVHGGQSRLKSD